MKTWSPPPLPCVVCFIVLTGKIVHLREKRISSCSRNCALILRACKMARSKQMAACARLLWRRARHKPRGWFSFLFFIFCCCVEMRWGAAAKEHAWKLSSDWPIGVVHVISSCDVRGGGSAAATRWGAIRLSCRLGSVSQSPVFGSSGFFSIAFLSHFFFSSF